MRTLPELRDVNSDQQDKGLQTSIVIDRDTASRLGVAPQDIDNVLYDAFGQRFVSTIYRGDQSISRGHGSGTGIPAESGYIEIPFTCTRRTDDGSAFRFHSFRALEHLAGGQPIRESGLLSLCHSISRPTFRLGQATQVIENAESSIGFPATIHASFQGTAAAFQESLSNEPVLILTALAAVYIVLGILYESYIHPITILSTLPSAGVGALLALLITHNELNVIGLIGIILLIGIVKKNAIMMIDFALDAERREGKILSRSDSRSVPAALPADHDDHDGRSARRVASRVGHAEQDRNFAGPLA